MTRTAVGTIVAKNFVSFARVLADSFRRHHPAVPLFVVLADEVDGCFAPSAEPFHLLHLRDLAIPDLASSRFHSTREQVAIASKPYLLSHLVERGFERVVFLDPDILVLSDLTSLFDEAGRHSVTLTPHLLKPPSAAEGVNRELNILQSGIYNAGFIGVSNTQRARDFLVWWRDRLRDHCRRDVAQGMFYDQRWLDLAPVFFEDVHVLRDPAVNVAYWNLPERDVRLDGDRVLVDGEPCRFFHFSGFDPDQPLAVTKYASRLTMADAGPAAELYAQYLRLLDAAGYQETKAWPYAYGHFDNGVPVPDLARQIHRELGDASTGFGDPLRTAAPGSYFNWLNEPIDAPRDASMTITRLWRAIYEQRPDLRRAFPDLTGAGRAAFLRWTAEFGVREHDIPEHFLGSYARAAILSASTNRSASPGGDDIAARVG